MKDRESQSNLPDEIRTVYASPWLRVREQRYTVAGSVKTYAIVERSNTAVIIPLSSDERTLLVRQYRYPTEEFSWELPMGGIDEDENPEDAARRELREETGIAALRLEALGQYRAVPGLTPQRVHVFVAHVAEDEIDRAICHENVDDIGARRALPMSEVFQRVASNEITDGFTLASLMLFRSRRE